MLLNREKMAEFLGCSLPTIDKYKREGMPCEPPRLRSEGYRFDTAAAVNWLRQKERQSVLGEVVRIDETEARRRKLAAEAAMAEFELAKAEGRALLIDDFARCWEKMIGACRAKLLGLGSKLGPGLAIIADPSQCSVAVDRALNEALEELTEFEPQIYIEPAGDREHADGTAPAVEAVGATARSNGQRMGGRGKTPQH